MGDFWPKSARGAPHIHCSLFVPLEFLFDQALRNRWLCIVRLLYLELLVLVPALVLLGPFSLLAR